MSRKLKLPAYFDYSSTTPVEPTVFGGMLPYLCETFGNPTSLSHYFGWKTRDVVVAARHQISVCVGSAPSEIIWTSGSTESDNIALKGIARTRNPKGNHIVTTTTEHKAVLNVCKSLETEGFVVSYLPVKPNGTLGLLVLANAIRCCTALVSVAIVNHEIGVTQDLQAISKLCQNRKVPLHVDASQAIGKVGIDVTKTPVSALSLSAHKCYGPKGVGALYLNKHNNFWVKPLVHGGGQELGVRSGTLPAHQIVGMGLAYDLINRTATQETRKTKRLGVVLVGCLLLSYMTNLNGSMRLRIPHNINLSFGCVTGDSLIGAAKSIGISSGSACSSSSLGPSYVLQALGYESEAHNSVRFSVGRFTTRVEVSYAIVAVASEVLNLRQLSVRWTNMRLAAINKNLCHSFVLQLAQDLSSAVGTPQVNPIAKLGVCDVTSGCEPSNQQTKQTSC